MFTIMDASHLETSLTQLGIDLPASVRSAVDAHRALQDAAQREVTVASIDPTLNPAGVAKALDKIVADLSAAEYRGRALKMLEPALLTNIHQAIAGSYDDLIDSLRPVFDRAVEHLRTWGRGLEPGTSEALALIQGGIQEVEEVEAARQQLVGVFTARSAIENMCGYAEPDVSWWITDIPDMETLGAARVAFRRGGQGWHHLLAAADAAGYALRLNTKTEAEQVVATAQRGSERFGAEVAQSRRDDARDPLRERVWAEAGLSA